MDPYDQGYTDGLKEEWDNPYMIDLEEEQYEAYEEGFEDGVEDHYAS